MLNLVHLSLKHGWHNYQKSWSFSAMATLRRVWHNRLRSLFVFLCLPFGSQVPVHLSEARWRCFWGGVVCTQRSWNCLCLIFLWVECGLLAFLLKILICLILMWFLFMSLHVCLCELVFTLCVQCLWMPDKGVGAIGAGVTGGFD